MRTKAELEAEIERLRKIILEMHKESEQWRRFHYDRVGYPPELWRDKPPPI